MSTNYARIAVNKAIVKEFQTNFGRTVYLENGDEFQIELFNYETEDIEVTIELDGKRLSNSLILKPGQRVWLERYFDVPRKFKFSTYEVEDSPEANQAISKNGEVVLKFYRKEEPRQSLLSIFSEPHTCYDGPDVYFNSQINSQNIRSSICNGNLTTTASYTGSVANSVTGTGRTFCSARSRCADVSPKSLGFSDVQETGRTEQGSHSSQEFQYVNERCSPIPFYTEKIKILPKSRKPFTANDLEKLFCTNCGRKLKTKYKFCPYCGTEIE